MKWMFSNASSFNAPINTRGNKWNVGKVSNMNGMFSSARSFNQDISDWNTSNVKDM